jgi:hypothetical protein
MLHIWSSSPPKSGVHHSGNTVHWLGNISGRSGFSFVSIQLTGRSGFPIIRSYPNIGYILLTLRTKHWVFTVFHKNCLIISLYNSKYSYVRWENRRKKIFLKKFILKPFSFSGSLKRAYSSSAVSSFAPGIIILNLQSQKFTQALHF